VEENIIDDVSSTIVVVAECCMPFSNHSLQDDDVGNYLTSAFWAALTIGRLLIVPLAAYVKPQTILLIDVIGCLLFSAIQGELIAIKLLSLFIRH